MRAGVIQECKRRRYFENKQDEKKRRTRDAAKRNKRRFGLLLSDFCFTILLYYFLWAVWIVGELRKSKEGKETLNFDALVIST